MAESIYGIQTKQFNIIIQFNDTEGADQICDVERAHNYLHDDCVYICNVVWEVQSSNDLLSRK